MPEVNEEILQFAWQNKTFKTQIFKCVSGKEVKVLKPGTLNRDAGPDFFNARIELDGITLAGNIEIHVKSSDWLKHGHDHDCSYDNIILHVVFIHDLEIPQTKQHSVETIELKYQLPERLLREYASLRQNKNVLACSKLLVHTNDLKFSVWLQRMSIERLENKLRSIEEIAGACHHDPVETYYILLLRAFGFKVNAEPFELLAKHLPAQTILKYSNDLFQLEALLFGMSGFLEEEFKDDYLRRLQNEAEHLIRKHQLIPLRKELFKLSRMRPANFPTTRLAQLASFLNKGHHILLHPQDYSYKDIIQGLQTSPGKYWQTHYTPGDDGTASGNTMGVNAAEGLIINAIAPYIFYYGKKHHKPELEEKALELLSKCGFEANAKTKLFSEKKQVLKSAADSQALIHLYDHYCMKKQCLRCSVATDILRSVAF